jgi:hypothetical protein
VTGGTPVHGVGPHFLAGQLVTQGARDRRPRGSATRVGLQLPRYQALSRGPQVGWLDEVSATPEVVGAQSLVGASRICQPWRLGFLHDTAL